ncbi:hypothetical protein ZWY2020_032862 [Hordeum vulgare]|nr:hypothetical protein ZWY2020_032862 [Hordeum vulgare]
MQVHNGGRRARRDAEPHVPRRRVAVAVGVVGEGVVGDELIDEDLLAAVEAAAEEADRVGVAEQGDEPDLVDQRRHHPAAAIAVFVVAAPESLEGHERRRVRQEPPDVDCSVVNAILVLLNWSSQTVEFNEPNSTFFSLFSSQACMHSCCITAGATRSQTGDWDRNRWLFETKGTYGYGNAIWPKENDADNGGGGAGGGGSLGGHDGLPAEFTSKPWRPLTRKLKIPAGILSPYMYCSTSLHLHIICSCSDSYGCWAWLSPGHMGDEL